MDLRERISSLETTIQVLQAQVDALKKVVEDENIQEKRELIDQKVDRLSKAGHY